MFQAEALAITQAIKIAHPFRQTIIYTDSLSVLQALEKPFNRDAQILQILQLLQNTHNIHFGWIKAHAGTLGNEIADLAAKSAALQSSSQSPTSTHYNFNQVNNAHIPLPQPLPKSKLKRDIKEITLELWQTYWNNIDTGRKTYSYFPKPDTQRLISNKWLNQFYTGHGCFPFYLNRFKCIPSPYCICGDIGHPDHYIFSCPLTSHLHAKEPAPQNLDLWKQLINDNNFLKHKLISIARWLNERIDEIQPVD